MKIIPFFSIYLSVFFHKNVTSSVQHTTYISISITCHIRVGCIHFLINILHRYLRYSLLRIWSKFMSFDCSLSFIYFNWKSRTVVYGDLVIDYNFRSILYLCFCCCLHSVQKIDTRKNVLIFESFNLHIFEWWSYFLEILDIYFCRLLIIVWYYYYFIAKLSIIEIDRERATNVVVAQITASIYYLFDSSCKWARRIIIRSCTKTTIEYSMR
jgi:hypothetical protein